jgi:DNA-binding transcriptional MerR regulator
MPEISGLELAKRWGISARALRFYGDRGLISSRRQGRVRIYSQRDSDRIGLILRAKKLGFTLAEIGPMIGVAEGAAPADLRLTAEKCLAQIAHLEGQMKEIIEALAELRRIHLELCRQAGAAASGERP